MTATHILSLVQGDARHSNGVELGGHGSPYDYTDLPEDVHDWLDIHGYGSDQPNLWVLITPADEDPNAPNVVDARSVTL
uniref:hypothetical protein n=1 Tax=Nonomuraea sp. CA-251285 TaxID=3240002 RepID=UPI003F49A54A